MGDNQTKVRYWWHAVFVHREYGTRRETRVKATHEETARRKARSWLDRKWDCDRFDVFMTREGRIVGR